MLAGMEEIRSDREFGHALKRWRAVRNVSQLQLSLEAGVSQRHISWLETGRSRPSRSMVLQLAEALDVPLRERNQLLGAAGFADVYREHDLEAAHMEAVRGALEAMLAGHEPYPCLVVDRLWNIVLHNRGVERLFSLAGSLDALWREVGAGERPNIALLTLHPRGFRPLIANFDAIAESFVVRIKRDMARYASAETRGEYRALLALLAEYDVTPDERPGPLLPALTLDLRLGDQMLRLLSVVSTFGTPQDVTTDELRIESFFPADEASRAFLEALGGETH
jgi:transcriptional regulator with XRE-family HTH domain